MKDTYYFSHDYNARNDPKLINVRIKHGMKGVGIYWCLIEMLYEQGGYIDLEYERITYELREDENVLRELINTPQLFTIIDGKLTCNSVLKRLKMREDKSEKARESISYRWSKYERNTNVSKNDTIKERKGKERKGKEIELPHNLFPQIPINPNSLTYEQTLIALETEQRWKEEMAMEFNTELSIIEKELTAWMKRQNLSGKFPCDIKDTKSHFYHTLNKKKDEKKRSGVLDGKYTQV